MTNIFVVSYFIIRLSRTPTKVIPYLIIFWAEQILILFKAFALPLALNSISVFVTVSALCYWGGICWTRAAGPRPRILSYSCPCQKAKGGRSAFSSHFIQTRVGRIPLSFPSPPSPVFWCPLSVVLFRCFCRPTLLLGVIACHRILHSKPVMASCKAGQHPIKTLRCACVRQFSAIPWTFPSSFPLTHS